MVKAKNLISFSFLCQLLLIFTAEATPNTPQFVYMEIMRRKLEQQFIQDKSNLNSFSDNKIKVSSSVEPQSVQGLSTNGFAISKNSKLELTVNFSSVLNEPHNMKTAVLWFFPEQRGEGLVNLYLLISVSTSSMKGEKRKRVVVTWNKMDACISLDVTTPVKKLLKQFQQRHDEMVGNISIEITNIKTVNEDKSKTSTFPPRIDEEVCRELSSRNFSKPFLVFNYEELDQKQRPLNREQRSLDSAGKLTRRDLRSLYMSGGSREIRSGCTTKDLIVNLTEVIIEPETFNIRDCTGSCYDYATTHGRLKNLYKGGLTTPVGSGGALDAYCVPWTFSPLTVLIKICGGYAIEILREAVVESCRCL